jgi:hypothetical protein
MIGSFDYTIPNQTMLSTLAAVLSQISAVGLNELNTKNDLLKQEVQSMMTCRLICIKPGRAEMGNVIASATLPLTITISCHLTLILNWMRTTLAVCLLSKKILVK